METHIQNTKMGRNDNLPYSPCDDHGGNENPKKWQITLVECFFFFFSFDYVLTVFVGGTIEVEEC
jgi:hypothetical protein